VNPSWSTSGPTGRQNCKPWSEKPQSARADFKSWNNDWSSSILGFRCKKFNYLQFYISKCWFVKLHFELKFKRWFGWLHFRPLVLISALADCKCPYLFFLLRSNLNKNLSVSENLRKWEIFNSNSIASLVLCFERSPGKEHFQKHSGPLRSGSGAVTFCNSVVSV